MIIIGAGMAGLLAGQHFRSHSPVIIENQKSLPNNHKALLRFRSEAVSDLTGIRFKKVTVHKMINYKEDHFTQSNLFLNNLYSQKVIGGVYPRSALNLEPAERYIAPGDFIQQASNGLNIMYGMDGVIAIREHLQKGTKTPIISTMPLSILASTMGYQIEQALETRPIMVASFTLDIDIDVYQTVYYPNPGLELYRMSITGNKVICEFTGDPLSNFRWAQNMLVELLEFLRIDFGIITEDVSDWKYSWHKHGKLVPADQQELQAFMGWATREYNVYSLGRWGTHRQLLMDDVVHDLKVIDNLIHSNNYRR